jgi:hypothetical protein
VYFVQSEDWCLTMYRDKKIGVFVRFRAPLQRP